MPHPYRSLAYRSLAVAGLVPLALLASPASAQGEVTLSTGIDYSSGDYGDVEDTDMLAIPFAVKYDSGSFYLKASIPYLDVEGPSGVIPGDGGATPGAPGGAVTSRSGLGDLWLTAGYSMPIAEGTWFDAVGKAKLPTASESKFLGTGSTDFTAQGEVLHMIGPMSVAAYGGRRFNGSSDVFDLRDTWLAGAGVYLSANRAMLGLDYDWREGSTATSPDISELTGSITYKLTDALRLQGYGYTGLADGSPDIGGGLQVLVTLGQ
ncbi:hypothetical protein P7228_15150 [Altererythrobacter arenosus]|uniref:Transporter n=1 Tax=Altererythrobacter arenosus TaxID=3032592 RepID=A0ABY8FQL8_9SPHN|nr:hypothetical protein [Altererythrobacter sp. CAU 1644]WFL77307.1 hypothetical protein P7228_15150 [Altererythrobacter sp. CAU 1644]